MSTLVIITGASRGIGQATSLAFAKDARFPFLTFCLIARSKVGLSETQALVQNANPRKEIQTSIHPIDLSDLDTLESNIKSVFQRLLDSRVYESAILINNAGSLGHVGPSAELPSLKEMQRAVDLNVTSALWISSYFVNCFGYEHSIKCTVVNISSLCAVTPFKTMGMYCMGKAAVSEMFDIAPIVH